MIVIMEKRHVYMCNHSRADQISWRVNGGVLGVEIFPLNITSNITLLPGGGSIHTLTIGGRFEHNETTVVCSAAFNDGSVPELTPPVMFQIQGQFHFDMYH